VNPRRPAPAQPAPRSAPARYLHGKLVTVIAAYYGGYVVIFVVSQLWQRMIVLALDDQELRQDSKRLRDQAERGHSVLRLQPRKGPGDE
jgi:hypothetical protein